MEKIKAYIDEKNVCTDWIEDVFDRSERVWNGEQVLGFVNGSPVYAWYKDNMIAWQLVVDGLKSEDVINELKSRLMEFEDPESNLYSEMYVLKNAILQHFYFKDED